MEALVLPAMALAIAFLIIIMARLTWRDHAKERRAQELEKSKAADASKLDH